MKEEQGGFIDICGELCNMFKTVIYLWGPKGIQKGS